MSELIEEGHTTSCRHCRQKINPKTKDLSKCAGSNPRYRFLPPEGEPEELAQCRNCEGRLDNHSGSWAYCPIPNNSYLYDQRGRPTGGWNTCCQCRTKLGYDEFEAKACDFCKLRNSEWLWIKLGEEWKKVRPDTGDLLDGSALFEPSTEDEIHTAAASLDTTSERSASSHLLSALTCCFSCMSRNTRVIPDNTADGMSNMRSIEFPKHIRTLPPWVLSVPRLSILILDNCSLLETLPISSLVTLKSLAELRCNGCPNLWSPPQEVCAQGGETTMKFLRDVQISGKCNKVMTLFLIGDGEAGKTSVIQALKSTENVAQRIREDHRTVGIDVSDWAPEDSDMEFQLFDLAGQAVYSKTHQLFLQRRALYMLVWRADEVNIIDTVLHWMDSLQIRMPGSFLLLVATHIDMVKYEVLTQRCDAVCDAVTKRLEKMTADSKGLIPLLKVCDDGQSTCVNCIAGKGIPDLRKKLTTFAESMPWYKESLPVSWIKVKAELLRLSKSGINFLPWNEYEVLASKCRLAAGTDLIIATRFFHETCVIRYFGFPSPERNGSTSRQSTGFSALLKNIVFISLDFVVNIMKGLIRHDHDTLLQYFIEAQQKSMIRRTNRLSVLGRLHEELVPFLWPKCKQSADFWNTVRKRMDRENGLWPKDVVSDEEDVSKALALLESFYLIVRKEREFLVPGLLVDSRTQVTEDVFNDFWARFRAEYVYSALPGEAFDGVLVRIAQQCSRFELSRSAGAFYHLGNILQVYVANGIDGYKHIFMRSSSRRLFELAKESVENMERFLGGLVKIDRQEPSYDNIKDPVQVLILIDDESPVGGLRHRLQKALSDAAGESLVLEVQLPSSHPNPSLEPRVVLVCMTASIGSNEASCLQLQAHIDAKRAIIPLIMPGFSITNFSVWWPDSMRGLEHHKLFVDMRSADQAIKISKELVPQIIKFLQEWKTADISSTAIDANLDISCENCILAGFGVADCHRFSRQDCMKMWDEFVKLKNKGDRMESDVIQCPKCLHSYPLTKLISSGHVVEVRPCNVCLAHGTHPPGVFKASECRLMFAEDDRMHIGMITCTRCQALGRPGQFRIMDVAPAEVFVSYNWGRQVGVGKYSTQQLVSPLLRTIEEEADIVCWFDVGGGMGAGQDQIEEMRIGVIRANVVLMFLSDAYVNSDNCKREFIHASRNLKFIVPVLVPDTGLQCGNGFSSGWTGSDSEPGSSSEYWRHAESICRDPHDPDEAAETVDWSYLGLFDPIRLPRDVLVPAALLDEIVKRIVARLHRGNHRSAMV